jgi:ABC-2 type transport system ATP-binding protein
LGVLEALVLTRIADRPVRGFSKGQAQRVSLAAALLGSPRLLILDEPMSGLDPEGRHLVRTLIRDAQGKGATILFSSHVLADIEDLCDAVTIIDAGRTVASGPVDSMAIGLGGFKILTRQCADSGASHFVETEVAKEALTKTLVELELAGAELVSVAPRRRGLEQYLLDVVGHSSSEER